MLCPDNGPKFASLANVRHRTASYGRIPDRYTIANFEGFCSANCLASFHRHTIHIDPYAQPRINLKSKDTRRAWSACRKQGVTFFFSMVQRLGPLHHHFLHYDTTIASRR
jgi:hypothetical protein